MRLEAPARSTRHHLGPLLFVVAAIDLATYSAIVPLLPGYSDRFGASDLEAGILVGAFSAAVVLFSIPAGYAADRIGMRSTTVWSALLFFAGSLVFAFAPSYWWIVVARIVQGAASGIAWSAGMAWLAAIAVDDEARAGLIGRMTAGGSVGLVAGPLLGVLAGEVLGVRTTFLLVAALAAVLAVALRTQPDAVGESRERTSFRAGLASTARTPAIRLPILLLGTVGLIGATLQTLLPLDLSDQDVSDVQIGVVFAISALVSCAAGLAMGRISSRVDLRVAAAAALVVVSALAMVLATAGDLRLFVPATIVVNGIQTVVYVAGFTLSASEAVRYGIGQGLIMGVGNLIWGLAAFAGPIAGGGVSEATNMSVAYVCLAALAAAQATAVGLAVRRGRA
jgi:predicted MFS family arabinose efflux permease